MIRDARRIISKVQTVDDIIFVNTWFVNVLLKIIYSSFRQSSQKRQKSPVSMISWSLCSFCEPVQRFWTGLTSQWLLRARDPQWALLRKNESFGGFDIWQFYKIVRFVASNLERYSEFCSRHFVASKPFFCVVWATFSDRCLIIWKVCCL